jgi:Zn-dependent peptidase ImmA (M78 family)/DNA-binding XRE family transcriptional regulator
MANRVEAIIKPELLLWARRSAGLQVDQAAKKIRVKPERLASWERGESRPTVKQLRRLGRVYRRPLAVFYLPEPPLDFHPMHDFRRLPGEVAGVQSPELRYEIRRALNRREIALELYEAALGPITEFTLRAHLSEDPDRVAERVRAALDIALEVQAGWKPGYETFNGWRTALEDAGVLVLQMTGVEVSETRGFSSSDTPLPTVVVNVKDSPTGRCFTMFHELAHVMLREGGLCDLDDHTRRAPEELQAEVFCNMVAGATLMPRKALLAESAVRAKRRTSEWQDHEIKSLADRYGVSKEAMLRRLLILGRTSEGFYKRMRKRFAETYEAREPRPGGFAPPHRLAISSAGPLFVRLVLSNYHQEIITASAVSDYLEIRLKHLDKIESAVLGAAA